MPPRSIVTAAVVASLAALVVARADNPRTALVALCAAAALTATRVRFATYAAVGLLLVVAVLAVDGRTAGGDERPPSNTVRLGEATR